MKNTLSPKEALKELMRCFNWHNGYSTEDRDFFYKIVQSAIEAAPQVDGEPVVLTDELYECVLKEADKRAMIYAHSIRGQQGTKWDSIEAHIMEVMLEKLAFQPDAAAKIAEAKLKGEEEMWLYFDKKLRYIHAHKIEWLPYEDWIKSIDKGMQELNMFRVPDVAAKIAHLESALASHKLIFDMLSGIDDVDTTPQEGDTSFVCILKELIANERKAQKDRAELVKALEECKDDLDSWGQYASEYFKEKHDLKGCIAKYDALLTKVKGKK